MTKVSLKQQQKIRELVLENTVQQIYDWVLDGTLPKFPRGFWSMPENYDYARICVKHLVEDILQWDRETICKNFSTGLLSEYKLYGMYLKVFDYSLFKSLDNAFPNEYKPWELKCVNNGYWDEDTVKESIKWLLEDKLHYTREQICKNFSAQLLKDYGLNTLLYHRYSVYELLNTVYPDQYKPWELKAVSDNYWNEKTAGDAIKWLLEDKLHYTREQICENYNYQLLKDNGFSTIAKYGIFHLLDLAYPDKFKPWELSSVTNNYWDNGTMSDFCKDMILKHSVNPYDYTPTEWYQYCSQCRFLRVSYTDFYKISCEVYDSINKSSDQTVVSFS